MDSTNSYSSSEIKSGLFVLITIIMLLVLTFVVGGFFKGGACEWKIRFGYLNGLGDNAPVYYAGHEVGKVDRIEILKGEPRPILVTVKISPKAYLRKDTGAYIDTLGMMGEKFVELSTGSQGAPALASGTIIEGTDPIAMHVLIRKMNLLADQMEKMVGSLNPLLSDVNHLVEGHQEELAKSIANLHEVTANLRDMTADLKHRPWRLLRKGS